MLWWWHQNKIYLSRVIGVSKGKIPPWQDWQYIHMISIYNNNGRNCLDSKLFGHFRKSVTQVKYFMINGKILFQVKWIWKAHIKNVHQTYKFAQYRPKLTGFTYHLWRFISRKMREKVVRESYSQHSLLFLTSWNFLPVKKTISLWIKG